jgi:hypothetical protein
MMAHTLYMVARRVANELSLSELDMTQLSLYTIEQAQTKLS